MSPVEVMQAYLAAINGGDIDAALALTGPGFIHHSGAGDLDRDGMRAGFGYYKAAFPDFRYELAELIPGADGVTVAARWTMRGTQHGEFFDAPPSGRAFASPGLSLHRVVDGRLVEEWEFGDDLEVFKSLGFSLRAPEAAA